ILGLEVRPQAGLRVAKCRHAALRGHARAGEHNDPSGRAKGVEQRMRKADIRHGWRAATRADDEGGLREFQALRQSGEVWSAFGVLGSSWGLCPHRTALTSAA